MAGSLLIWTSLNTRIVLAVAGLGLGALVVGGYVHERERAVRAETVAGNEAANRKLIEQKLAVIEKQMADREAQYQSDKKAQDAKFARAASPSEIANLVTSLIGLQKPIQMVQPLPTAANPHPAPVAQVSTEDAPQVKAYIQACEECRLERPKLQADLADTKTKLDLQIKTTASVQKESDQWKITAKGGTWLERAKKTTKVGAIGGAIVAAIICGTGHCK